MFSISRLHGKRDAGRKTQMMCCISGTGRINRFNLAKLQNRCLEVLISPSKLRRLQRLLTWNLVNMSADEPSLQPPTPHTLRDNLSATSDCQFFSSPSTSSHTSHNFYPPPSKRSGESQIGDDSLYLISVTEHGGSSAPGRELENNTKIWSITRLR